MQEMAAQIFKKNQTLISQMLHGLNMLPFSSSVFRPPPITPMLNVLQRGQLDSHLGVGILQGKKWQPKKYNLAKKKKKEKNLIKNEVKIFEVHRLIAIQSEMEKINCKK